MTPEFRATTAGITVSVQVFYLPDQSKPAEPHFVWAYQIKITNESGGTVQLMHRTWRITDAQGRTELVHGAGVVGEQPVLANGETFEYASGAPLPTPSGFMRGTYHMRALPAGTPFDIAIPTFSLDSPYENTQRH
jgi:ApaG protein